MKLRVDPHYTYIEGKKAVQNCLIYLKDALTDEELIRRCADHYGDDYGLVRKVFYLNGEGFNRSYQNDVSVMFSALIQNFNDEYIEIDFTIHMEGGCCNIDFSDEPILYRCRRFRLVTEVTAR